MQGTLILSPNRGRYAVRSEGEDRGDLSSGQRIQINVGGQWISGHIEYNHGPLYAAPGPQTLEEIALAETWSKAIGGYYFVSNTGAVIGLCISMEVRVG